MTDVEKLEGEKKRGHDAEYLLEHPLFVECVDQLRRELRLKWEQTDTRDTEARERLWMMLKLLNKIVSHFETIATTGKLASAQLTDVEEKKRRFF